MTIISEIKAVSMNATGVDDIKPSRYDRDDLDSAKEKVKGKLLRSKEIAENGCNADDVNAFDTCFYYVPQKSGYYVGVKYGNRWVKNVFGENENRFGPLNTSELIEVVSILNKCVDNGELDQQIKATMMY